MMTAMASHGFGWVRGACAIGLSLVLAGMACAPPHKAVRGKEGGDGDGAAGEGGEGGAGGDGGRGGSGGTMRVDADGNGGSGGGNGGTGGSGGGNGGTGGDGGSGPPDAARDMAADRTPDVAGDVAPDGPVDLGPGEPVGGGKSVLLVMGFVPPATVRPGDLKLKARLEMRGFTVKIGDDDGLATQAMGTQLVIITETAGAQVGTKYRDLNLPVICHEPMLFDDMRLTAAAGAAGTTSTMEITQTGMGHPLAAGQMATVTIAPMALSAAYGAPAMTAERIATMPGQAATQSTIFGYASGAMMATGTAPAKRVGLFVTDAMANGMNETGWKLFDAAVDWALQ
jgi:hypothetical protein